MGRKQSKSNRTILSTALLASIILLGGCAQLPRFGLKPDIPKEVKSTELPVEKAIGADEQNGFTEIETSFEDVFISKSTYRSDPFPSKNLSRLSFSDVSINDALELVLKGTGISLTIHNSSHNNQSIYGSVTNFNVSGTLQDVIEKMSNSIGFFYEYQDGSLHIYNDSQFIVELPPIVSEDVFAGMTNTITKMGGFDVYLDRHNRNIIFRANKPASKAISGYLEYIRKTKNLIVYDTYIYQVDLSDSNKTGIDWTKLNFDLGSMLNLTGGQIATLGVTGTGGAIANGIGFNAVYDGKNMSLNALFSFLKTQGNIKTVAQPKIAVMSGSKGRFKVGTETNYISKVGTNTATALNQTTVETSKLITGLSIGIMGEIHDGTIYTHVNMSLTDLVRFNDFQALGTQLSLPQTTNRDLETTVRSKPGNIVLLSGINSKRDSGAISGLPGSGNNVILNSDSSESSRSELVIVMKPKVISYVKTLTPKVETKKIIEVPLDGTPKNIKKTPAPVVAPVVTPPSQAVAPVQAATPESMPVQVMAPKPVVIPLPVAAPVPVVTPAIQAVAPVPVATPSQVATPAPTLVQAVAPKPAVIPPMQAVTPVSVVDKVAQKPVAQPLIATPPEPNKSIKPPQAIVTPQKSASSLAIENPTSADMAIPLIMPMPAPKFSNPTEAINAKPKTSSIKQPKKPVEPVSRCNSNDCDYELKGDVTTVLSFIMKENRMSVDTEKMDTEFEAPAPIVIKKSRVDFREILNEINRQTDKVTVSLMNNTVQIKYKNTNKDAQQ